MQRLVFWLGENRWLTAGLGAGAFFLANPRKRRKGRRRRRRKR
jgi:hypothetical protein